MCEVEKGDRVIVQLAELPDRTILDEGALAKALMTGAFDQSGSRVTGKWPLPKDLIESLTAGL